jgi:hypothetical protein
VSYGNSSAGDSFSEPTYDAIRDVFADQSGISKLSDREWNRLREIARQASEDELGFLESTTLLIEGLLLLRQTRLFRDGTRLRGMCSQIAATLIGDPNGRVRMLEFQRHLLKEPIRG